MTMFARAALRAAAPTLLFALLAGCAAPGAGTEWSQVSMTDQHRYMPALVTGDNLRPLAIVTAGPTGLVVGAPLPPATRMVAQNGQLRLVSQETYARMKAQDGATMGAPGAQQPAAPVSPPSR